MDPSSHRRDFIRSLAVGASAGALAGAASLRADEPKDRADKPKDETETPKSEADARMELVLARFGKQLDADALKVVRGEVESVVRRAEALRKIPLSNGDGPYPIFRPFRAPLA
jgi:hypothetical protein